MLIKIRNTDDSVTYIEEKLKNDKIDIINMKVNNLDEFFLEVTIYAKLPKGYNKTNLIKLFNDNPLIKSLEV